MTPEQIEIERKKFEAYWNDEYLPSFKGMPMAMMLGFKEIAEKTWIACCESRDSLCVTLPKFEIIYDDHAHSSGNYYRKEEIDYLLQSAGINYRVEE